MRLRFETQSHLVQDKEKPLLVDADRVTPDSPMVGVLVDGAEIEFDDSIINRLKRVVSRMTTETLADNHYRDCIHFVMAMSDIWLPTSSPLERGKSMSQICDNTPSEDHPVGLVSTGVPNDERCIGFGDAAYVYMHAALGVTSSEGVLYLQKLGIKSAYSLATADQMLAYYDHEVIHPIVEMSFQDQGVTTSWSSVH